ncbi:hypothetical protein [Winogradskyella sp.]|uniref:hypothetical protein n=1 Tax=Winogradskyella sp. TaxID=1883156 RepID=UPI00351411A4
MRPTRRGQVVKFHTPYEDEDPDQLYVILEYIEDGKKSRAKIMASNPESSFKSVSTVLVEDLEVDEGLTFELDYYLKYGQHDLF